MTAPSQLNIDEMPIAERLRLISQLWDSIPDSLEALPVPDSHREEIERRLVAADANPADAIPWEDVERRLREKS